MTIEAGLSDDGVTWVIELDELTAPLEMGSESEI